MAACAAATLHTLAAAVVSRMLTPRCTSCRPGPVHLLQVGPSGPPPRLLDRPWPPLPPPQLVLLWGGPAPHPIENGRNACYCCTVACWNGMAVAAWPEKHSQGGTLALAKTPPTRLFAPPPPTVPSPSGRCWPPCR